MIRAFTHTLETMKEKERTIPIEKEMFGEDNIEIYVFRNELLHFCSMEPIDVTSIVAYTR